MGGQERVKEGRRKGKEKKEKGRRRKGEEGGEGKGRGREWTPQGFSEMTPLNCRFTAGVVLSWRGLSDT